MNTSSWPRHNSTPGVDAEHWRRYARDAGVVSRSGRADALARTLLLAGLFAIFIVCSFAQPVHAQASLSPKIAPDLALAINAQKVPNTNWVKTTGNGRFFKVIVVGMGADPLLTDLRNAVAAAGGAVNYRYQSIQGFSATIPGSALNAIAVRSDVDSISPNRPAMKSTSFLELTTGAGVARSLSGTSRGYDGSGVGIAIVDSGIYYAHAAFTADDGKSSRVAKVVDVTQASAAANAGVPMSTMGQDLSVGYYPGSASQLKREAEIDNSKTTDPDQYGHGTLVASVAAGRSAPGAPDATGIAPNATLFDVKVLDATGVGEIGDVLAGIDWVIYHSKEYNIRVMNLSLAADSTESFRTDPLCRAVRSAAAAGLTVVVAAGNYGMSATGVEQFGTITSPGDDPSVITVGSSNSRNTALRSDDVVNGFSSRGPTRGVWFDGAGMAHADNVLKPDLVAPGNRVVGAMSDMSGSTFNTIISKYPALRLANYAATSTNGLMSLSGTSISAPGVAGTVALMLQANPGLTSSLIKAILQYTAQPLPGASLVQQGAGSLNIEGAVRVAQALRSDIAGAVAAGTIHPGDSLLAAGKTLPNPFSLINGETINWGALFSPAAHTSYRGLP